MTKNYFLFALLLLTISSASAQIGAPSISPITGPGVVCSAPAQPKIYNTSATSATSYFWSVSPALGVNIASPNASATAISFANTSSTYTVFCYASNSIGSSQTVSMVVNSYETPQVSFSGNTAFCQGSPTNIQASPTTMAASSTISYTWNPTTGLSSPYASGPVATLNSTTTYTVTYAIGSCTNSSQFTASVVICNGINEIAADKSLLIYPNPSNGEFHINGQPGQEAIIFDATGKLERKVVISQDSETVVRGLTPGIYFILSNNRRQKLIITQ